MLGISEIAGGRDWISARVAFYEPESTIFSQLQDSVVKRDGKSVSDLFVGQKELRSIFGRKPGLRRFHGQITILRKRLNFDHLYNSQTDRGPHAFLYKIKLQKNLYLFFSFDFFLRCPTPGPSYSFRLLHFPIHNFLKALHLSNLGKVAFYSHRTNLQTDMALRTGQ